MVRGELALSEAKEVLRGAMPYFVYVLANPEGKVYIGQTGDLARRLREHNAPEYRGTLHAKRLKGPWTRLQRQ